VNEQQAPLANGPRGMKLSRAGRMLTRVMTGSRRRPGSGPHGRHPLLIQPGQGDSDTDLPPRSFE
jgi:hypothetical protein